MKQLTLVVDDKIGLLADISYLMGRSKINIEAISLGVIGGKAVINMTVKDPEKAVMLLQANGYRCLESDMLVVKLANTPGELAKLSRLLAEEGVNIENVTVLTQDGGFSLYAVKVDKTARAEKALKPYLYAED